MKSPFSPMATSEGETQQWIWRGGVRLRKPPSCRIDPELFDKKKQCEPFRTAWEEEKNINPSISDY